MKKEEKEEIVLGWFRVLWGLQVIAMRRL